MRSVTFFLISVLVLSTVVFSTPWNHDFDDNDHDRRRDHCLTHEEALKLRDDWIGYFVQITPSQRAAVRATLSDNFQEFSDSLDSLTNGRIIVRIHPSVFLACFIPKSTPISSKNVSNYMQPPAPFYSSPDAFLNGQIKTTPPNPLPKFTVIAWDHGCNSFTFRWTLTNTFGASPIGLAGIDLVFIQEGSYRYQTAYSEYNNVLFLAQIGCHFIGGACGMYDCKADTEKVCIAPTKRNIFG